MSWQEFKDTGLLGCAKDYDLFLNQLGGVIERAQQGANHHTGKALETHAGATTRARKKEDPVKLRQGGTPQTPQRTGPRHRGRIVRTPRSFATRSATENA